MYDTESHAAHKALADSAEGGPGNAARPEWVTSAGGDV